MIKQIFITALLFILSGKGFSQTAAEWQADLRHLQQAVHTNYKNLFYNVTAADWDRSVDELDSAIPKLDKNQILAGFMKLVAQFHVGHTQMNTYSLHEHHHGTNAFSLHRYPFMMYWFNDGLYIIKTDNKYANAVAGKVTRIGNMKTDAAWEAIRPLVSYENEQGFKSNGVYFLAIPEFLQTQGIANNADEVSVSYKKNEKEETIVFKAVNENFDFGVGGLENPTGWTDARISGNPPLWQKESSSFRYMEYIAANKTLYVRHSATLNDGDKTIASFFNNMADYIDKNDVQKLILDIRLNGGGNNYLNKAIITSIIASKKINQPGKFFCIIGRRTFSAAQNLTNELEKYTEVTFVGEPTAENVNFYGDTRVETLPNSKLEASLSWMWWQNLDPRDSRKATSPSLAVDMSFKDYQDNIDPVVNAIFNAEKARPLVPTLKAMLASGKKEEALAFAIDYKKDPQHRYLLDRIEPDINLEGYNMMTTNPGDASALFEINTKLFPESANAFDSYAESFMYMGRNEEAIKYYQMAIAKDKEGITAENSKKMIEKMKGGGKN